MSVESGVATPILPEGQISAPQCSALFSGIKYCTRASYSAARSDEAPYFPLNGDTMYVAAYNQYQ